LQIEFGFCEVLVEFAEAIERRQSDFW
jgi:hypothetical protein